MLAGQPVKVTGIIVYNFVPAQNSATATVTETRVAETKSEETPLTEEQKAEVEKREKEAQRRQMLAEKLHFWVFALFERLQKGAAQATPNEGKFVKDGKAEVQIRLTAKSAEAFNRLKALGFEIVEDKKAKIVVGRIAVEKLGGLAEIAEVQYVLPNVN